MTVTATSGVGGVTKRPLVAFKGVGRTFGEVEALAPCDLAVDRGEFVSIVGPSGCGKSTLLRLASNLDQPTAGGIEFATDSIGYVFQDATLMPWRNVRRNVGLLAELSGMSKARTREAVDEALATVGLSDFDDHLPRQLSGGMKMRASLARSLVLKPEVFLFDEPFGALDEITRGRLNLVLQDLFLAERFAGLFVTHSVEEAVFLSTHVVVMSARPGRIVAEYDIPFDFPRSLDLRYTAEFAELAGAVAKSLEEAS
ncbi:ABC transporter ATP-binding protein [Nocardioides sp. YIM 152588]|uniref:ABC transporter ATP-binding protein n=1 Tax=Nocardioides sp. YIM 152588 TaxID=3158259 RepID=UPI0032E3EF26